ncbi:hypothetical protein BGX24_001254, partial [Mortierella sp. AD032]
MKITTLSAVLCLVATTALADKKATIHAKDLSTAASVADIRDARHHEINGSIVVKRADGPKGVNRHENQKKSGHKNHGVEAHSDGGSRYHDKGDGEGKDAKKGGDDEEEEEEKEKKGGHGDKKGGDSGDKKGDDGGDKKGNDDGDKKGDDGGDKKGDNGGDKKGSDGGDKKGGDTGDKKGGDSGDKKGGDAGDKDVGDKKGGGVAAPAAGADDNQATTTPDDKKGGTADPNIPRDYASPLWLVQPFGSSVWAQGETYVVSWGPNPDPVYAKSLNANTPVEIRLMQGPPDNLKEIAILSAGIDSSIHMLEWLVPTTVTPATDYSIRMSHAGDLDTYSHYFE